MPGDRAGGLGFRPAHPEGGVFNLKVLAASPSWKLRKVTRSGFGTLVDLVDHFVPIVHFGPLPTTLTQSLQLVDAAPPVCPGLSKWF